MNQNLRNRKILDYGDVAQFPAGESTEPLVDVTTYDSSIVTQYIKVDMIPITGESIYVRDSIAKKLAKIESSLREKGYRLKIVYGYRHPSVQAKYFYNRRETLSLQHSELSTEQLDRYTHSFVAAPSVAGHPAGAAVDLTIIESDGSYIDMGTAIADYSDEEKIKTFGDGLTEQQQRNRKLLHDLMVAENFAPFYGEWWHFSYGDREWAAFYNKKALFGAIEFNI